MEEKVFKQILQFYDCNFQTQGELSIFISFRETRKKNKIRHEKKYGKSFLARKNRVGETKNKYGWKYWSICIWSPPTLTFPSRQPNFHPGTADFRRARKAYPYNLKNTPSL